MSHAGTAFNFDLRDRNFQHGMEAEAEVLLDPVKVDAHGNRVDKRNNPITNNKYVAGWDMDFLRKGDDPNQPQPIDGVFLIAANNDRQADMRRDAILGLLNTPTATVSKVRELRGQARDKELRRHEQ